MGQSLEMKNSTLGLPAAQASPAKTKIYPNRVSLTVVDSLGTIVDVLGVVVKRESKTHAKTLRPPAGHRRPVDPENSFARAAARLGHLQAHPAAIRRRAVGATGVALSGASPARTKRMDRFRVEGHRARPQRQVLRPDTRGKTTIGAGTG